VAPQHPSIQVLEEGDIFFFYRPRVGVEEVKGREDVQRLYMITVPRHPRRGPFRFVIGRKKLPAHGHHGRLLPRRIERNVCPARLSRVARNRIEGQWVDA
jgi:hypothetical protein